MLLIIVLRFGFCLLTSGTCQLSPLKAELEQKDCPCAIRGSLHVFMATLHATLLLHPF
jgi:hypothetical protein